MPSRGLDPDVALSIQLGAIMSRNQYTRDPAPVIAELYDAAGGRTDLLAREVGSWIGFYGDSYTRTLTDALRALPLEMDQAIQHGERRRLAGTHSTYGFASPAAHHAPRNDERTPTRPGGWMGVR